MKAIEVMGNVDKQGQLSLDVPLTVDQHTRVRVIVLLSENADEENNQQEDKEISESAIESFRHGWDDAITVNILPVSQLWEGMDVE
ncbi:type II toxin-antitoxin system RelN family antitoxin [Nostoc sp.]|uniref:type II toxin-antitoxin system RelN family antitoxin n=1 Tax=Nostoc sp. TaxID=1180 RepID=UPI002FFB4F23